MAFENGCINLTRCPFLLDHVTLVEFGNGDSRVINFNLTGITTDGNFLVFDSNLPDLVVGDTNNGTDVFVRGPLLPTHSTQTNFIPAIPKLLLLSPALP